MDDMNDESALIEIVTLRSCGKPQTVSHITSNHTLEVRNTYTLENKWMALTQYYTTQTCFVIVAYKNEFL